MAKKAKKSSSTSHYGPMPSEAAIEEAGHEMKVNPPSALASTKRKFGAKRAEAQRTAILMNKARSGK